MGAPKSRLMKVKEESEKGEKEGKGKKERGRERAERREGGKGQKGEREGGRERLHLDSPSGTGHRRRIFSALCFDLQIHVSTSPWGREGGKFFLNVQQSLHPERALQGSPHPPPQHGEFLNTQFTWNHFRLYLITESRTPIILGGGLLLPRHFLKLHTFSVLSTPACPNPI